MGDVSPVRHNRCPDHRKLDEHHEFLLIAIVMENPCLHLHEMCSQILHRTGVQVSGSTVCRVLEQNGFTRKKIKIVAKQRPRNYKAYFMAEIYNFHHITWFGLTKLGVMQEVIIRKFGYSVRGIAPVCLSQNSNSWQESISHGCNIK